MTEHNITLKSLREKYQFNKELRKYSDRYYFKDNSIFGNVKTNKDVEQHKNYILNSLKMYKEIYPLVQEDIENVERAMARLEIAVRKVIQNYDNPYADFNYTADELQLLIDDVFTQHENVNKLTLRKLYQD